MDKRMKNNIINSSMVLILLVVMVGMIVNFNYFDSNEALAKGRSGSSLKLISMGPTSTPPGVNFQVQSNGESAIWVKGENFNANSKIVWGNTILKTYFASTTTLTALVPKKLYAKVGNYGIYVVDTKTKKKSNQLVFSVEQPVPLKLSQMGPTGTKANELFQVQPNGVSAMWIKGEGITRDTKIYWGATQLDTYYQDSTTLTAFVPTSFISKPGKYEISLKNLKTKVQSNKLIFTVQ